MSYVPTGFTSEQEGHLLATVDSVLRRQKADESRRRWALIIGGFGAFLAAVRLGVIVIPKVKTRRMEKLAKKIQKKTRRKKK